MPPAISKLIDERNKQLKNGDALDNINNIDKEISNLEAQMNYDKIKPQFDKYKEDPEKIILQEVWKTMEKLWPKSGHSLPTAKKNHVGKVISEPKKLKALLAKEYKERLRMRPLRPDFQKLEDRKNCQNPT